MSGRDANAAVGSINLGAIQPERLRKPGGPLTSARAKGLGSFVVTWRHALRNAIVPVITMIGIYLGFVLGSTVIFEQIFALPGIGRYMIQSINSRDYPAVQAVAIVVATFVVIINLVVDIAYGVIDPRIRYGSS